LRGLEDKMEKALGSWRELEHRQSQINAELARGWEPAAKYQELKIRLEELNQSLMTSGTEIESSPDLSKLDEDALRPVESGVSVHQLLSLAEQSAQPIAEIPCPIHDQDSIISDLPAPASECAITAESGVHPEQIDEVSVQVPTKSVPESESAPSCNPAHDENQTLTGKMTKGKAISKFAVAIKDSRQMGFNWS
jgi:hypothetical protein